MRKGGGCGPRAARGRSAVDWLYSGWSQEMLGITYPDLLPIAYADWPPSERHIETVGPRKGVIVPAPPPGECPVTNEDT